MRGDLETSLDSTGDAFDGEQLLTGLFHTQPESTRFGPFMNTTVLTADKGYLSELRGRFLVNLANGLNASFTVRMIESASRFQ